MGNDGARHSDYRHSDHPEELAGVRANVRPLVGLLGQEGGDAASEAARLVLTGLAVERPLAVISEVSTCRVLVWRLR